MDTGVLKDKKKVLSNDKVVVERKEFMPNELNVKHRPHTYNGQKIDGDNDMPPNHQTYPMLEKTTSSSATQQRYKVLTKLN